MTIKLLDCTLRDGGYVNDWNFGHENIIWMFQKLQKANLDIVEVGYIRDKDCYNPDRAVFPNTDSINLMFDKVKKNTSVSAMIDYGACKIEFVTPKKNSFIDILRVTFKKDKRDEAIEYCKKIKEKGYIVFLQPVSITSYTDREMLDLIDKVNALKPMALSIVDSYGLMHEEKVIRYFHLMDNNLLPEIGIAYHSHNNFQLAYANSIGLLNIPCKRNLYFDASLYGMGKSAGNCNTELMAMYLNDNFGKSYDISEILEIIDMQIIKLSKKYSWGYQLPFYISALNDCHPNYVNYLFDKNMLTVKEINEIVNMIDEKKRLVFDEEYIERLYLKHQSRKVDDKKAYYELESSLNNLSVLLLGPGRSISNEYEKIEEYIHQNKPVIFSVNHINKIFDSDYVFISNAKRFEQFENLFSLNNIKSRLILTSNIENRDNIADYVLNWNKLSSNETIVGNTSLYLLINMLIKLNVSKVVLAGFDGFSKYTSNYYDNNYEYYRQNDNSKETTRAIIQQINQFQKYIKIEFLTKSRYQVKDEAMINV